MSCNTGHWRIAFHRDSQVIGGESLMSYAHDRRINPVNCDNICGSKTDMITKRST
ncbi:hypothetical protein [Candidatus Nitrosocosmicus arcticus]|uniref:Uncharacterized protein n=1 Tax=Candidatus Nitrosocosmicus arcticus TaxID=2035267 RepID=A0A557SYY5_9ARCH|nr:hypothetical protein [Candidatus Nitrosocosmicus arcticus]TVP41817.1 hypothetical protein NARC_10223 [Candidatus Nitrosocosmicus arcticus]